MESKEMYGYDQPADPPAYNPAGQATNAYNPAPGQAMAPVMQQPTAVTVNIMNPSMNVIQVPPENVRQWAVGGVCSCCDDCGVCMKGWCCGICMVYDITKVMGESCCFVCCSPVAGLALLRTKLRIQYGISGSIADDYCCACCCTPLVMCQLKRQLNAYGRC